jgi:hypothetical protein
MNEDGASACVHLESADGGQSRSSRRTMDGFARNADTLGLALNIPPQHGRTDSQNPRLVTARICNFVSCGCWYIIFFEFV